MNNLPAHALGVWELDTAYLPAVRASEDTVLRQQQAIEQSGWLRWVIDALPDGVVVLNQQRQIVFANQKFVSDYAAILHDPEAIAGARLGEAVNCIHAFTHPGGCGTTPACSVCGAAQATLKALRGQTVTAECRITRVVDNRSEALDLRVSARPLPYADEGFVLLDVNDISSEKRRQLLERLFFHDIANTANIITTVSTLLQRENGTAPQGSTGNLLSNAARRLIDEIKAQRILVGAEEGSLDVTLAPLPCGDLIMEQLALIEPLARTRRVLLQPEPGPPRLYVQSDSRLLGRVLGNLLKNAVEASAAGETVTLGYRSVGSQVEFWVHNPAVMPKDVQLQLFQRSFSTKGAGRGLGTYSVKLLVEQYLHGAADFSSISQVGTEFSIMLPGVMLPANGANDQGVG